MQKKVKQKTNRIVMKPWIMGWAPPCYDLGYGLGTTLL
jgi:hypothetical protein